MVNPKQRPQELLILGSGPSSHGQDSTTMTGEYQSSPTLNQQYEDDDDGDDEVVTTATLERRGDVFVC